MKTLITLALVTLFATSAQADNQYLQRELDYPVFQRSDSLDLYYQRRAIESQEEQTRIQNQQLQQQKEESSRQRMRDLEDGWNRAMDEASD